MRIYAEPVAGQPYVIGGDPAGDGSDRFVLQCVDNVSKQQAATFRRRNIDEDEYAKQAFCMGIYYNEALIAMESNWSTYPILELERMRYPRQYVREAFDHYTHRVKDSFGFRTDRKTRPVIISHLISLVREDITRICDADTLEEMLTFVRSESMRPEAEVGAHDDCIMALAIAGFAGRQQRTYAVPAVEVEWTEDMKEDYLAASEEERCMLIRRWGVFPG